MESQWCDYLSYFKFCERFNIQRLDFGLEIDNQMSFGPQAFHTFFSSISIRMSNEQVNSALSECLNEFIIGMLNHFGQKP